MLGRNMTSVRAANYSFTHCRRPSQTPGILMLLSRRDNAILRNLWKSQLFISAEVFSYVWMVSIILTIFYKAYVPGAPKCEINHACSSAHSSFPSTPLKFGGKGSEVCTYTSSFLSEARSQSDRLSGIWHAFALILELSVRQAMPAWDRCPQALRKQRVE